MNATTRQIKITAAQTQIDTLQAEKGQIQDGWLARGMEKTEEMVNAISDQIINLYEEIDALVDDQTTTPTQATDKADEIGVSPAVAQTAKNLGWTIQEVLAKIGR